jgi:ribosome maturation factor RimP
MLEVSSSNKIILHVDSMKGVSIDECIQLSRAIEHGLDREAEDFELEVSSAGLDAPFTMRQQYLKNMGRTIAVLLAGGKKEEGKLTRVTDEDFTIERERKVKVEGKKKKQVQIFDETYRFDEVYKVKLVLNFK